MIESLIESAQAQGASDLHLEPGMPPALRVRGMLKIAGEPLPPKLLIETAREWINPNEWQQFLHQRSADLSRTVNGVRCRINIFHSVRGIGFAIRLLSSFQPTIDSLNLHPDLKKLVVHPNGLILVSGPTGSGKSTTLAALVQEINATEAKHILTLESPIEYPLRPVRAYIRQREVGRDTPSFEQGLLDSLREDPDVLMVGEMREPSTMRLTLNASETGHLVLSTVHSSSCAEALQRLVSAFPSEIQSNVAAQLADCLVAVIAQRLHFREDHAIRVPECEILIPTHPVKHFIRNRDFFKIASVLETGAEHGMWTFPRYRSWIEKRTHFQTKFEPPLTSTNRESRAVVEGTQSADQLRPNTPPEPAPPKTPSPSGSGRIEIEPDESEFGKILK